MSARETATVVASIVGGFLAVAGFTQWQMGGVEQRLQSVIASNQVTLTRQNERLDTIISDTRPTYAMVQATDRYVRQNIPAFNEIAGMLSDELSEVAIAIGVSTSDLASASTRMNQLALDMESTSDPEFFVALRGDTDTLLEITSDIRTQYIDLNDVVATLNGEVIQKFANLERRISALPWASSYRATSTPQVQSEFGYAITAGFNGFYSTNPYQAPFRANTWNQPNPPGGVIAALSFNQAAEFFSIDAAVGFLQSSNENIVNAQIYRTEDGTFNLQYQTVN